MKPTPEQQLIIACAAGNDRQIGNQSLREHCSLDLNWPALIQEAFEQGVLPLVYRRLSTVCPDAVPDTYLQELRRRYQLNAHTNFLLSHELIKIVKRFKLDAIVAIPFKGPFWAEILYQDLAVRQCADIDIIIQSKDVHAATDILVAFGYLQDTSLHMDWEAHFFKPDSIYVVDLHWGFSDLFRRSFGNTTFRFDLDAMWRRTGHTVFLNRKMRNFEAEDILMIVCQNSVKDFWKDNWPQLKWVRDLARIIELHPAIDWGRIQAQAARLGNQRLLHFCLCLTQHLFATTLPRELSRRIHVDKKAGLLADEAMERLLKKYACPNPYKGNRWEFIARHRFCIRLKERKSDQFAQVLEAVRMFVNRCRQVAAGQNPLLLPKGLRFIYPLNLLLYRLMRPLWHVIGPNKQRGLQ